jgi:Leucine-rich repeat (LRR) protein
VPRTVNLQDKPG